MLNQDDIDDLKAWVAHDFPELADQVDELDDLLEDDERNDET